jgi:serine/threonine-protein kinase
MLERIGAYRLESPLGRGGMGEVFLAWDERLERPVAIKRIRQDAFLEGHHRERFRREAQMAARLSHAAVVQIHDLVTEESGDAIVMEYVEGPTLAQRLSRGPLDTEEALRLAREIAEGLAAAHMAGLIHRDLKAENVIVTSSGHAKILDFGLARPVSCDGEMLTLHGALIGTCYAMSPEQARGEELDERTDLFSFGALLYEMLTGSSPFRGKDPLSTLQRVLHEQPPLLSEVRPDLPLRLSSLVERLLAKDRDDRPRDAHQVAHKLELIERELPATEWPEPNDDSVSDLPTHAFPVPPGTRSSGNARGSFPAVERSRSLHRAPGWILFLAGALSALVITVMILYFRSAAPPLPKKISVDDVAELKEIKRRISAGTNDLKGELARLGKIQDTSPDLPGAWILAADLAGTLYESTGDPADLDRARRFIERAQKLAPKDPGTLRAEFRMAMVTQQLKEADRILKRLEAVRPPADPNVLLLRSSLMERQNRLDVAEKALREAVKRAPPSSAWYFKSELAWFELNHGKVPKARRDLEELLKQNPKNPWVKGRLAYLELFYGDLARAEQLYGDLARAYPQQRTYFTSLGQARSLQGRYKEAEEAYSRAQDIDVGHKIVALNLADTEWDLGHRTAAKGLYGALLKRLEGTRNGAALSPQEEMMKAQCLARLGYADKAREAARQALSKPPEDAQRLFEAALVYSVIGDRAIALGYVKASLDHGMAPRWFQNTSAFDSLRRGPELQALLGSGRLEQGL